MAERPDLTYDAFLALARQQGLVMDESRLQELFPEVQAMFRRIALLDRIDASDVSPASNLHSTDTDSQE